MNSEEQKIIFTSEPEQKKLFGLSLAVAIFAIIWFLIGFIAFIYSLICFGKSGSILDKLVGLFLAVSFGPFYFIYLFFYKSYCR